MADARALLRQEREARRIKHPFASYTSTNRLVCSLCQEIVGVEALWPRHLGGEKHLARLENLNRAEGEEEEEQADEDTLDATVAIKRKFLAERGMGDYEDDGTRRKRSKADIGVDVDMDAKAPPTLPPHARHPSGPAQGVEFSMASRPATPRDRSYSSTSIAGPSPPRPSTLATLQQTGEDMLMSITSAPAEAVQEQAATAEDTAEGTTKATEKAPEKATTKTAGEVDEDEWAAFEADIAAATAEYDESAVISAPAMTAAETAAQAAQKLVEASANPQDDLRKSREKAIEEDQDDAARAFEEELEDMKALEERLRRLKEKREALLRGELVDEATQPVSEPMDESKGEGEGKDEDDDSDEDLEEDDDWNGFRIKR